MALLHSMLIALVLVLAAVCNVSSAFMLPSNATNTATFRSNVAVACGADSLAAASSHATIGSNLNLAIMNTPLFSVHKSSRSAGIINIDAGVVDPIAPQLCRSRAGADDLPQRMPDYINTTSLLTTPELRSADNALTTVIIEADSIIIAARSPKSQGSFMAAAASLNNWTIASLIGFAVLNLSFVLFM